MNIHKSIQKIVRRRELQREKTARIKTILILATVLFIGIFIGNIFLENNFSITGLVTGNLPDVGDSNWGTILNNYLLQEHTSTGAHKNVTVAGDLNVSGIIRSDNWTNVSITESQISNLHVWNATNSSYRTLDNLTFEGNGNFTGNLTIGGNLSIEGVMSPNTWPSFSVNKGGTNQVSCGTSYQLITWSTEEYDTNNNFDLSTERFTPTVPGKYILTARVLFSTGATANTLHVTINKSGNLYKTAHTVLDGAGDSGIQVTAIVDANGTGDWFEVWAYNANNADTCYGDTTKTFFQGTRIA